MRDMRTVFLEGEAVNATRFLPRSADEWAASIGLGCHCESFADFGRGFVRYLAWGYRHVEILMQKLDVKGDSPNVARYQRLDREWMFPLWTASNTRHKFIVFPNL